MEQAVLPEPVLDVIGWLLFIRHYGGTLGKYGGASGIKRSART
jgi:hypothetical protein